MNRSVRGRPAFVFALSCFAAASPLEAQDLATAIADALAHAPLVAEAQAGAEAADARVDRARAERNPSARIDATAGVGYIDNGGFFGIKSASVTPVAVQATTEIPVYTGGRVEAAVGQARAASAIARSQLEQARLQTSVATVSAYTEVLTARATETSLKRSLDALREVERQAGLRFRVGEIASTEVAQAKARRAEAEAGYAQAQGRRASAEAAFERLTGKIPVGLAPLPSEPATPGTLDEAIALARDANPGVRQANQAVALARVARDGARAEGRPTLAAFAEAGVVRDQFFPDYRSDSVTLGVRGRWTFFDGGRVAAQVRVTSAELAAAEARARQASLATDGAVTDAWQDLIAVRRMIEASRLRKAAADDALRSTRLEAQVGMKPTLAVLDAEREALAASTALTEAEGRLLVAAWRLNAATGDVSR